MKRPSIASNGRNRQRQNWLAGEREARIIAPRIASQSVFQWTLRLLARKVVELKIVASVSYGTLPRTLKNGMTNRKIEYWIIQTEADAESVAHIEEVLESPKTN